MLRSRTFLLVAVASVACARADSSSGIEGLLGQAPQALQDSATAANAEARRIGLRFSVWPANDSVVFDTTVFEMRDHPCGATLSARFKTIPVKNPIVDPERLVEFDSAGRPMVEWRAPTDRYPVGLQGDELFVSHGETFFLGIRPSGEYRIVPRVALPEPADLSCPTRELFPKSAYARCRMFADLASGKQRRLGFEGPCT
jgi:hypothetical protein